MCSGIAEILAATDERGLRLGRKLVLTRDSAVSRNLATYCACLKNFSPATVMVV
jgi:hypothetical protein